MKDLIIIGASGFGREVSWLVERINKIQDEWNLLGFIDDDPELFGKTIDGYKVLGGCLVLTKYPDAYVICAIAASSIRKKVIQRIRELNANVQFAILIDPTVEISKRVKLGIGNIICAHSILTVDISLGNHVIINLDCTVGHDAKIHDFVTLYPSVNVSGKTNIGECVEIGTGTQIIQGKTIGNNSVIGAGAVVVRDIPDNCTAVGMPAKPIKFH